MLSNSETASSTTEMSPWKIVLNDPACLHHSCSEPCFHRMSTHFLLAMDSICRPRVNESDPLVRWPIASSSVYCCHSRTRTSLFI
jgi:hypothetical protein